MFNQINLLTGEVTIEMESNRQEIIRELGLRRHEPVPTSFLNELSMRDPNRRTGRTTRIVDYYVQALFNNGCALLTDHHWGGEHPEANENLFNRVMQRLQNEHSTVKVYSKQKGHYYIISLEDIDWI